MAVHFTGPILYKGVNSVSTGGWNDNLTTTVDPDFDSIFDDFAMIALDATNDWTVVKDAGAAVAIAADTAGGVLTITSANTTDNDGGSIQGNEIFLPAAGREIWFETRIKSSLVAQNDIFVGLTENFATDPEAVLTASNRIGLQVNDEDASVLCKTEKTDTETSTDSGVDLVNDTYVTLGFHVINTDTVEFYVDRKLVATHAANIPTTELAPAIFSLSGSATGQRILSCDYVMVVATR